MRPYLFLIALLSIAPHEVAAQNPNVPEPMLFDLVRGLGASRGELEVNLLVRNDFRRAKDAFYWNPEIEYLWRDGVAFELELAMDRTHVEAVKVMTQVTFGIPVPGRYIHGGQVILERSGLDGGLDAALLYIGALRFTPQWSLSVIQGAKYGDGLLVRPPGAYPTYLGNATLFHETSSVTAGIELNLESPRSDNPAIRIMPQIHIHKGAWAAQFGIGVATSRGSEEAFAAIRLVRTLVDRHQSPLTPTIARRRR